MKPDGKLVLIGTVMLIACVLSAFATVQSDQADEDNGARDLHNRVAALEEQFAALRQQVADEKLANRLRGRWMEESWIRSGKQIDESKEVFGGGGGGSGGPVEWLLATDTSSKRIVLSPEPVFTFFGEFRVDTSKTPAWIDLELFVERDAKRYPVRGIVKYDYQRAKIAIPTKLFEGQRFLNPPRPTNFESTAENGYSVYSLIRKTYKETGV